jgi:hypothetical protein
MKFAEIEESEDFDIQNSTLGIVFGTQVRVRFRVRVWLRLGIEGGLGILVRIRVRVKVRFRYSKLHLRDGV